ncbi:hypothetical protein DS2_06211 [Catenovulum agarivorans DS-2]|uniref:Hemerythrin-like domain-containing protein n=1 Tax=Catenovulum agarivorans DS-2 TaxID=1328313 RepID=W7QPF0_9ALTE|nr:hemerythrin domain-containing protein [Catenovulum agarivorans]EWH10862.1 hypothetical protein DS2_06211 [Catenovulum agarivorans DS-2]
MSSIFEALREDHDKQRALLSALVETQGDSKARADLYQTLKDNLEQHAVAEERYFYAPLIKFERTIGQSRHGIAEHHTIDKLIAELDSLEFSDPNWLKVMKKLQDKVLHHLAEEEKEFFPQAGIVLSENDKAKLGKEYAQEMD